MTESRVAGPEAPAEEFRMELDQIARLGAQRMLRDMLQAEVDCFIERNRGAVDDAGRRHVVRNGHLPVRQVLTGAGALAVEQPRVRDRRGATHPDAVSFSSKILPPYLRRSKQMDELIPWLYLMGVSSGDFQEALASLVGPEAGGLSASTVTRLTAAWVEEHQAWSRRDLAGSEYVYIWADGIYFNIRLGDDDRQCLLVLMGATRDGRKELLAIHDGYRESEQSWAEVLVDLKHRGLQIAPKLAIGDGSLGFWAALRKIFPETREQRCWVHKTANVLNKLPRSVQPKAKADLHEIWMSETEERADKAFDLFEAKYQAKYPAAVACLTKDRDVLMEFYNFPAEHWLHLRTSNPIESTFATVRLRHRKTKGSGSRSACLAMVFKLACLAQRSWRRLNGHQLITKLVEGYRFKDGIAQEREAA